MKESPVAHIPPKMSPSDNPLWAAHFADAARAVVAPIQENCQIARETYRIRLECPEIAAQIRPGQFVMLRLMGRDDPLLARPFALFDAVTAADGQPVGIDVVYLVVGEMTGHLANCVAGESVEVVGPLGNGFDVPNAEHLVMVAGGIGQTPFLALAKEHLDIGCCGDPDGNPAGSSRHAGREGLADNEHGASRVPIATLCYGAKSSEFLAGVADFEAIGVDVRISTDDGSAGHHGLVTELLEELLAESQTGLEQPDRRQSSHHTPCDDAPPPDREGHSGLPHPEREGHYEGECHIATCGPEPMMEAVSRIAAKFRRPCQVSLETPMACGLGICFSCVAKVKQPDGDWDYKRTCVDGPVFDAEKIVW